MSRLDPRSSFENGFKEKVDREERVVNTSHLALLSNYFMEFL